jgi:hypothetical protein
MTHPSPASQDLRSRWEMYEERYGDLARASDAAWAASLTPLERLAIVDGLLSSVRNVRERAGDWDEVEARAWQAVLEERRGQVAAFHRLDEVQRGFSPSADAR